MTVDFSDYFWGEGQKSTGIEVLFQNVKGGVTTTRELADFFKERSSLEESHSKALGKLAKLAINGCPNGSFAPMWQVLRSLSEKLSTAHTQMVQKIEELVKEVLKYAEEFQKQYKSVKEADAVTVEAVQLYQNARNMLSKSKAVYMQRYLELEKCQKDSAPQKELEKAEARMKKAQEEYKSWVEKYQSCSENYVAKMTESCRKFQDVEIVYLQKMKDFMESYSLVMEDNHSAINQVHSDFRSECAALTVEELLAKLVRAKGTGNNRPSAVQDVEDTLMNLELSQSQSGGSSAEDKSSTGTGDKTTASTPALSTSDNFFEGATTAAPTSNPGISMSPIEVQVGSSAIATSVTNKGRSKTSSLLNLFIPQQQQQGSKSSIVGAKDADVHNPENPSLSLARSSNRGSKWFLRSRRDKKKEKEKKIKDKDKKEESLNQGEGTENASQNSSGIGDINASLDCSAEVKVDAEGFTIRPNDVWEENKNAKFYSDTDTDSEEEPEKRLHVEIKPLTNGTTVLSASVDELRSTVENLTLASSNRKAVIDAANGQMKRSHSESQQIGSSSPPPRHPYAPLSPPTITNEKTSPSANLTLNDSFARYAELGDIFSEIGEMQPALPPKTSSRLSSATASGTMSIPRPPSRPRPEIPLFSQRSTNSPSPTVSRTDSVTSLETKSIGSHLSGSRGPSPLTIGMTDCIPIAVAFHEIVHAYFRGNDENQCKVKMTGDMMVSFPAGIINVFTSNSSPALLTFQVRSKQKLENLVCNKNLVNVETEGDVLKFEFNMSALLFMLKGHAEQNPNASYFNVDILKYQIKAKKGADSCPLHLVAFWKCESQQTDLRIDYKFNSRAMESVQPEVLSVKNSPSSIATANNPNPAPLSQVCVAAPVDGGVTVMQSKPSGQWFSATNRACWKLGLLSPKSENHGVGSLRARFELTHGPSSNGTIAAQFSCENSTLSGCEFELLGSGYRVSLVKKRFVSGKYICDAEENSNRYAVPPEISRPVQL